MKNTPILVTGIHRSGTTFAGRVISAAPGVGYIHEPFNPEIGIQGIDDWYTYVRRGSGNEERMFRLVGDLLQGKARYRPRPGNHGGPARTLGRKLFGSRDFMEYRLSTGLPWKNRLLLKDPIASLASGWLRDRFNMKVVVMVRHPAGFAASTRRLDWGWFFLDRLTGQKELMGDYLGDILTRKEPEKLPFLEKAALLWRCIYTVLNDMAGGGIFSS